MKQLAYGGTPRKNESRYFSTFGFQIAIKIPHFSISPARAFNPLSSPLKYEKLKENHKTHNFNTNSYFIKNWVCYSKIENVKSLGILMLNNFVTSKF